ncbi:hypothetical protein ABZW03_10595 [Kitasatospora sp. NPDC004799]|uniref:hypothetical protein n=1 Tax=Kitasatospora sp. NPDC004799 TaxID=3154460 RepID=UPI0033AE834E
MAASRTSADHDPIHATRPLQRFEFIRNRPPVSADRALVFITAAGQTLSYLPNQQPTRGELVSKNFRALYEVETAYRHLTLQHRLPSRGDAFFFHAETDVTWRVLRPAVVVERGIRDVRILLEPRLLAVMRQETRRFDIEQSAAAEAAVQDAIILAQLGEADGIEATCVVRLSLDQKAIEQYSALRGVNYAKEYATTQHSLEVLRLQQQQQLTEDRSRFYATMLDGDDIDRWALHLASNPQDIPLALEGIRDDQREAAANQIAIVERMLDAGVLEDHMMEDAARVAVNSLKSRLADAAAGRTRKKPLYREKHDAAALEKGGSAPEQQS